MINISISEFRKNIKRYAKMCEREDILVYSNDKPVMKIVSPYSERMKLVESIIGCAPSNEDVEKIMESKLKEL